MFSTLGYYICIPFAWLVRLFYNLTGSYGVALILFTLVIKLIMTPFQMKSKKSMLRMSHLSGQMQELQKRYANNQAKLNEEMQKLYAEEGINPMSGCLWSFIPFPILIALYSIIRQPITHFMMLSRDTILPLIHTVEAAGADLSNIVLMKSGEAVLKDGAYQIAAYGQINLVKTAQDLGVALPEGWVPMNYDFIGLDLAATPSAMFKSFTFSWVVIGLILIPILAGASQIILMKVSMQSQPGGNDAAAKSSKMMMWTMPLMSVYIGFIMPAALGVYWIAQSVFSLIQEVLMNNIFGKKMAEEEAARAAAREADRKRRMEEGRRAQELQKQEEKKSLKEKQQAAQAAKAAKAAKAASSTTEAGRVGDRPYARGRAYKADRYDD